MDLDEMHWDMNFSRSAFSSSNRCCRCFNRLSNFSIRLSYCSFSRISVVSRTGLPLSSPYFKRSSASILIRSSAFDGLFLSQQHGRIDASQSAQDLDELAGRHGFDLSGTPFVVADVPLTQVHELTQFPLAYMSLVPQCLQAHIPILPSGLDCGGSNEPFGKTFVLPIDISI